MKLVVHIGMGKTGTSSIQRALATSQPGLASQRAAYLGMWFDMIDPAYTGLMGERRFRTSSPDRMRDHAAALHAVLERRAGEEGIETFVFSNESIFSGIRTMAPFLTALQDRLDLRLVAYLRDPRDWLPSAYTQWGIRHKANDGPVQPFPQRARTLIEAYENIRGWVDQFPDVLTVRRFDTGTDVVADFASVAGIALEPLDRRYLERDEPVETMLRAQFNSHYPGEVLPDRFNRVVINTARRPVPSARELADLCLRHDGIDEIVREKQELFAFVRDRVGLDFLSDDAGEAGREVPTAADLQSRLVDYLLEITLDQARRIQRLERLVDDQWAREIGGGDRP